MPKVKATLRQKATFFVQRYPDEFKITPNNELFSKVCDKVITCDKKDFVNKHRAADSHKRKTGMSQSFLNLRPDRFKELVVECMTELNIPLNKLRHPSFKKLAEYCGKELPSVSHSRHIVKSVASQKLNQINSFLKGTTSS